MRKLVIWPASVLALVVMLAACSTSGSSGGDSSAAGGQTVGFLVFDAELDTFVTALGDAVDEAA